jgi:hypothetical protein
MKNLKAFERLVFSIFILMTLMACGDSGIGGGSGGSSTTPTWISASWGGGAKGDPTDRQDVEATEWNGSICPASSVTLRNHSGGFAGLNIINSCTITVTYALCVSKGSLTQPQYGLNECATDPFQTPFSQLKFYTITNGVNGDYINATENLSVNVFYCSDSQQLTGPPLRCFGI